jgi:hypothetical protein
MSQQQQKAKFEIYKLRLQRHTKFVRKDLTYEGKVVRVVVAKRAKMCRALSM